ncbi:unnamed protein product [Caenorhabditis angaria]|uniref:Major facilitator superfamily (MFS) profile domain-containing protein n=1 Tax=Caenorhabditis angaria TaxID=860376 RepID=A0A9P1NCT7_9PELO|nr:unnamed protein product [Caenorhabditis angaria]
MGIARGANHVRRGPPPGGPRTIKFAFDEEEEEPKSELRFFYIVIFGFLILFAESGVRMVMNIFVEPVETTFNCTKAQADLAIISVPMSASLLTGPLISWFYKKCGARKAILTGSAFSFLGMVLGPQCPSIYLLMICTGFFGFGCGIMRNSIISVQCEYFKKKMNRALGIIMIGPAVGIFILPRIFKLINTNYGWEFSWYLIAIFYVFCAIMGFFVTKMPTDRGSSSPDCMYGLKIFKKTEVILFLLSVFLASSVNFIYYTNILKLMKIENIEEKEEVYSWQGIASVVGRIAIVCLIGSEWIHIGLMMFFAYLLAQSALAAPYFCYSLLSFRIQNFLAGFGISFYQVCMAPFLVALVGPSQLSYAYGYTNLLNGLAIFVGVFITTIVYTQDSEEPNRLSFFVSVWMALGAIILSMLSSAVLWRREKHKRKPSMKQMKHTPELNALTAMTTAEAT